VAYVPPYFVFLHAGRLAGDAAITMSPAAVTDFPKFYTIDGRAQSLAKHGSVGAATWVCDRGAGTLEAIDTLIIPAGHNLGAQTVTVHSDTEGTFATPTLLKSFTSAAGQIMQTFTSPSTERWVRVSFTATGSAWEYGELWLGRKREPAKGPIAAWPRARVPNVKLLTFDSGVTGSVVLGPSRLTYTLSWQHLSGTDLAIFNELDVACTPSCDRFYFQPPDDISALTLMEFGTPMKWAQDAPDPRYMGATYSVTLDMIEVLG